jgi:hypothetical protein
MIYVRFYYVIALSKPVHNVFMNLLTADVATTDDTLKKIEYPENFVRASLLSGAAAAAYIMYT